MLTFFFIYMCCPLNEFHTNDIERPSGNFVDALGNILIEIPLNYS